MEGYTKYRYKRYTSLSESEIKRIEEIDLQILELQKERAKILRNKTLMFEEERDYLASKIPDFYVNGASGLHRKVVINPKYKALWTGIRQSCEYEVFHLHKCPENATEDQIQEVKERIIKQIDWLDENVFQKGLLWV